MEISQSPASRSASKAADVTMVYAFFLWACTTASPPSTDPVTPSTEPSSDAEPAPNDATPAPAEPDVAYTALPAGVAVNTQPVFIEGYGFKLTLNPPFQAALLGREDVMIVAWWDVNAEGAGQNGRAGLYNITLVPGNPETTGDFTVQTLVEGEDAFQVLRQGEDGAMVRFPNGVNGLGGLGQLTTGSTERAWRVNVAGESMEWPEPRAMLHSWDPNDGGPARFQRQPVQPWGPWRPAPVPPAAAPTAAEQ